MTLIPVKDEDAADCLLCNCVTAHCNRLVTELLTPTAATVEHVLAQTLRWVVIQTLAHFDGDVPRLIAALTQCLNEPQNERLVHAFLERTGQEAQIPTDQVH